ncbi:vacuolar protein sorting-associated protein 8 homolog [Melanaphis sacchari]|uniref:Vacuolar protein sorting-associated protein 8 n=1 Tax=Melanaphis sacchari TaxID=742174 RepID=A0A2H8TQS9_9HEMI|nr:vacuolar protein sorting-associated protein 8 homolog [Melanaphis sacchari]XP_025206603.1 vacuolar protein sorting-associated protein 8 homolog [Melanaphis sacchari]XP_025206604.1 vacuolar protein sorting-associated protein 8 homolog [Melanaphis sacchari]
METHRIDQDKQSLIDILETLNLGSSEIDDTEFNIPKVNDIPTVESILNDGDISLLSEDDITVYQDKLKVPWYDSGTDSNSLGSSNSCQINTEQPPKCLNLKSDPGRILRHTILKPVSNQMHSFCNRFDAGQPSAIKFSLLIAIGTSKGFIILFDSLQTFQWYHEAVNCGAVSAIDFNFDCSRLIVGYINGTIIMFDSSSTTCKILRVMNDAHTSDTAVLHLKFTDLPNLAIVNNSSGSVFELNFKRNFGIRSVESKCLFSGGRGRVCCIEPLLFNQLANHPMNGYVIIAMATLSKVIIVTIRPNTELLLSNNIISSRPCLPLLSWQFVIIQFNKTFNSSHRIMDPVLAFTRDDTVYFYQVNINDQDRLCCCILQKIKLSYPIIACSWMNARTLLTMDSSDKVHLVDVRVGDEMEQSDLLNISLVYTSSYYNGTDSQHLDKCCYSSVHGYNSQLVLLGKKSVHIISIRSWIERLDSLTDKKLFSDALQLGVDFLEERGKAVLGLRGTRAHRHKIVKDKVINIVALYIDSMVDTNNSINYKEGIPIVFDISVHLQKTSLLFNRLWDGVEMNESSCKVYLECLKNYLVEGQFDEVPTIIIQKLFTYLSRTKQLKEIEKCILNVKVECLDIEQSLNLSRAHGLYDGLISIWTRALEDYLTPLQELIPKIVPLPNEEYTDDAIELGNKILIYLSGCLLGIAYPNRGYIPQHLQDMVRNNIVQFLCSQHSIKAKDDEDIYPYLRILLKFNTTEFLNVFSMAFSDCRFMSQQKQRICCILTSLIMNSKDLKSNQLGLVYAFIVRWQQEDGNFIKLDKQVFEIVTSKLISTEQTTPIEDREKAFIQLIRSGAFDNYPDLLKIAEEAKFYTVCREICLERGELSQMFKYYILDDSNKYQIFSFISSKPEYLEQLSYDNSKVLLEIDSVQCGVIFGTFYPHLVYDVSNQTKTNYQKYLFLKGAIQYVNSDMKLCTHYLELLCEYEPNSVMNFVKTNDSLHLTKAMTATKKAGLDNVTAIFLERLGDFQGAFDLLFSKLKEAILRENAVEECTEVLVALAQRGSAVLDPKITWLPILQCLLNLQSHEHLHKVLDNSNLNLATEMHLLLNSSSITQGTVGHFRNLIMGLIDKCQYEQDVLKSFETLLHDDLHSKLADAINVTKKGVSNPIICSLCNQKIVMEPMFVFRCGHGFHSDCLGLNTTCTYCTFTNVNL